MQSRNTASTDVIIDIQSIQLGTNSYQKILIQIDSDMFLLHNM